MIRFGALIRLSHFGRSIFFKQMVLYVLIILLISGVIGLLFFTTARQHLETEIGNKLQVVARISARSTPFEQLELIRDEHDESRMVLRLEKKLGEIQEATGVRNILVFRPTMASLLGLDPAVRIGSVLGLPNFRASFLTDLAAGNSVYTESYRRGEEIFISAYAPILDLEGRLFAIVGIDAGAGELAIIEQMGTRLYWIALISIAVASLLALLFARSITRPVREIAQTAERLGKGDYEARVTVSSRDEVGVLADSINRMAEDVRERDATLKEMAATVAHEIRNPLNSMKLLVSLLDEELKDGKITLQTSTLETLNYEIGKLNRFTEQFLTFSRPVTLIRDTVAVASLVANVLEMSAAQAAEGGVELVNEAAEDQTELSVDRLRLEQTLLNLVLNGIQACGGEGGRVTVGVRREGVEGLDLVIEDSGEGLSPEALPQIFDPFFTTKTDGSGLGLANARKIIEEHEGFIRAQNITDGGARMTVHLPAGRVLTRSGE